MEATLHTEHEVHCGQLRQEIAEEEIRGESVQLACQCRADWVIGRHAKGKICHDSIYVNVCNIFFAE